MGDSRERPAASFQSNVVMIVTPNNQPLDLLLPSGPRSPILHMSDIYGDLYKKLYPKRYDKDEEMNPVFLLFGLAFEDRVEKMLRANGVECERPPEQLTDIDGTPVAFSPDLFIYEGNRLIIGEIKWTSMSTKDIPTKQCSTLPPKLAKYGTQGMSYAYNVGTPYVRYIIGFPMGNYKKPFTPDFRMLDVEFSPRDLGTEWDMVCNHARARRMV